MSLVSGSTPGDTSSAAAHAAAAKPVVALLTKQLYMISKANKHQKYTMDAEAGKIPDAKRNPNAQEDIARAQRLVDYMVAQITQKACERFQAESKAYVHTPKVANKPLSKL